MDTKEFQVEIQAPEEYQRYASEIENLLKNKKINFDSLKEFLDREEEGYIMPEIEVKEKEHGENIVNRGFGMLRIYSTTQCETINSPPFTIKNPDSLYEGQGLVEEKKKIVGRTIIFLSVGLPL
eukprot:GHVP01009372.1.p1 GENE.GHVP01009372.1~~GHVP01009372.1.p1  ORF type:complete len:134 (-),score=24.46 GHVP01009372.1:90-461(-)